MSTLGANTIRVYHVDPSANHDGCMQAFDKAGIYTLIDMDTTTTYILANAPAWTETQYKAYGAVMDAFAPYNNTLGLFVGNEVIATANQSQAAPFIKAASRDMKAYRDAKGHRKIPVGYSAADIAELRPMLQDYLTCGGNASESVDFFSLNSYEWCDPSSYQVSGYSLLEQQAKNFPVPIFFSETGCNAAGPRLFDDQASVFSEPMVNDWSGSIVYEWIQEANHYGLVSYTGGTEVGGFVRGGTPQPVSPDFNNLKAQWAKAIPTGVNRASYDPSSVTPRDCPKATAGGWLVEGNVKLPKLGDTYTGPATPSSSNGAPSSTNTSNPVSTPPPKKNPASAGKEMAGMSVALVGVMLFFTVLF